MLHVELGRRCERLLFLSGPITLAALFALFLSVGSSTQRELTEARCLDVAIRMLQDNSKDLNEEWSEHLAKRSTRQFYVNQYASALEMAWVRPGIYAGCYDDLKPLIANSGQTSPADLQEQWAKRASELRNAPLNLYGVEIGQETTVAILGNKIKVKLSTVTLALQIALAPLLLVWLGSLYNTRHRETWLIGSTDRIELLFPHLLNLYAAVTLPQLRKTAKFALQFPIAKAIAGAYTATRLILLAAITLPATIAYIACLAVLPAEGYAATFLVLGALVVLFQFTVLIGELQSWHCWKVFPGPAEI